jgi:hypothetical protein
VGKEILKRRQREPGNNKYLSQEILLRRFEDIKFKILNNLDQKFAEPCALWLFQITLGRIKICGETFSSTMLWM